MSRPVNPPGTFALWVEKKNLLCITNCRNYFNSYWSYHYHTLCIFFVIAGRGLVSKCPLEPIKPQSNLK